MLPQISQAEYEVMDIIWNYEPISTNDIVTRISSQKDWSPKTIHTMLSRLEKKGVISHNKEGRVFIYSSVIPKEQYRNSEEKSFLSRFFDGAISNMIVSFIDNDKLTPDDIDELKAILDKKRNK